MNYFDASANDNPAPMNEIPAILLPTPAGNIELDLALDFNANKA